MRDWFWQLAWVIGGLSAGIVLPMLANLLLMALIRGWKRTPVFAS